MQSEMRIALEVRLYEDVLYELHLRFRYAAAGWLIFDGRIDHYQRLIRQMECNAYEVTWKRPNPPRREYLYGRYPV